MNANSDQEYIDNKVGDVRTAVDDLRLSTSERVAALHGRFDAVDAQFRAAGDQLKALDLKIESTVEAAKAEIIKWIAGLLIAMVALFVGATGTIVNLLSPRPAPSISAPALIIQLSPQGAVVLPAAPADRKP
ncbi:MULTISPECIES: hypothetical protein [unclassified Duganella]|uniref:hypothetical protein n=1 Tax=unclassified Duganella TaxID=2636909 RepID=UPI0008882F69|nr:MULTISPECIES: hypothetical protein [unclassified Duganella]SDF53319.1 hypothetical protein SAMN05216320_101492 [Duganella sp. OV458]SDI74093.1 hypothetical protein SAMN05428973_101929 [Duganella sp. OV510]